MTAEFFDVPILPVEEGELTDYQNVSVSQAVIDMPTIFPHSTRSDGTRFMDQLGDKKNSNINHSHAPIDVNYTCVSLAFRKGIENAASMTRSYDKGAWKNITWGSYEKAMEALMSSASSYELLYGQGSIPKPQMMPRKQEMEKPNTDATQKVKASPVKISARKQPLDGFPSNVKTLTGTGIFNEVFVRYVPKSGVALPAVIWGPGYFCGCVSCNCTKLLTAEEFERHAGFKTCRPNDHIRFVNGKSMHQVVQELKATPRDKLFDAILMVTGSGVNEKAFKAWKESLEGGHTRKQQLELLPSSYPGKGIRMTMVKKGTGQWWWSWRKGQRSSDSMVFQMTAELDLMSAVVDEVEQMLGELLSW